MEKNDTLHILWTSDDPLTARHMVFMYAVNALRKGWWEHVHVLVWGGAAKLLCEDAELRAKVREFQAAGGDVSACKRCAEELGLLEALEAVGGIDIFYVGEHFTRILKGGEKLLTV